MKFYISLRRELQGLGQEGRYEVEMGALGQATAELFGPKDVRRIRERAQELLRNRKHSIDSTSVVDGVEAEMADSGMELT